MKKRTTLLLFWLVIAIFIVAMFIPMGCGSSSGGDGGGGETGTVSGTVTDQNGLPVQSATCSIDTSTTGKEVYSSTSDQLGQFSIANVPIGTWTLSILKSGYQTTNIAVTVNSGLTTEVPSNETVITPGTSPTPTTTPTPSPTTTVSPSPTTTVSPTPSPTGTTTPTPTPTSSPGPVPVPGISGWEWQNPKPQGDFRAKGSYIAGNITISVGEHGMIYRKSGATTQRINSGLNATLNSVWGSSTGKNWFIVGEANGGSGIIFFSSDFGQNWARQVTGIPNVNLNDVYGAHDGAATNVFIVGNSGGVNGTILYSALGDGSDWANQSAAAPNAHLNGVWVPANGAKVFAVGDAVGAQSTILYSAVGDGSDWAGQVPPNDYAAGPAALNVSLTDVCGADGGTKVFAVGAPSEGAAGVFRATVIYSALGTGADWANQTNDAVIPNTTLRSVGILPAGTHAIACGDLVGGNATVVHSPLGTGADWADRTSANTGQQPLYSAFCYATGPVLLCSGGLAGDETNANGIVITSSDGITWVQNVAQPNHVWTQLNDISAVDANNVFAVGEVVGGRPLILSTTNGGTTWVQYAAGGVPGAAALNSVWARTSSDVYAVGDGGSSRRYAGVNWADNGSGGGGIGAIDWFGVHGYNATNIYAVGAAGNINRNNGAAWAGQIVPTGGGANQLNSVYCAGASNSVYAVGENADLWKYAGGAWAAGSWADTSTGVTATDDLKDVWASDANNVFVVGDDAATHGVLYISQNGGTSWTRTVQAVAGTGFESVWGSSATNVFMVGNTGSIFFYNGTTLQRISPGATPFATITVKNLAGVTGSSATDIFICGALDTIVHSITN
ncbi:MAG: carboxypeptidase regulatory-like domain-containing protein [Candidatus Eremiobacteraeota bacterium]|nr:carboxypeptidase regulatory-like domain-containing protein [Candidatus Eremiobacteraeota bacterium]